MTPTLGFWEQLQKPFFVLAPMANVTDAVFRRLIAKYGCPDVIWTEFVSADGLCHPKGQQALLRDLSFVDEERPVVTQLFSAHPDKMYEASKFVAGLGFDGIDINTGCPDKNVMKQGAGASLIKNPKLAQEVIRAAMAGVSDSGKVIPVSVKTRIGFEKDTLEEWLPVLLETKPAVITVHCRTKKEMSKVPAKWERVRKAVEIAAGSGTLIVGNGDVLDLVDAETKARETGCDGVMLGRAVFGNPWLFDTGKQQITVQEKLTVAVEHTKLFEETWGNTKSFDLMKKHYQAYVNHFPLAKELRVELMNCQDASAVEGIVMRFIEQHQDIVRKNIFE